MNALPSGMIPAGETCQENAAPCSRNGPGREGRITKEGIEMTNIIAGIIIGMVLDTALIMTGAVLFYEKTHPEDEYWRKGLAPPPRKGGNQK